MKVSGYGGSGLFQLPPEQRDGLSDRVTKIDRADLLWRGCGDSTQAADEIINSRYFLNDYL